MSLADILNPKLSDYLSPDTFLRSQTGLDIMERAGHKSIPTPSAPAQPSRRALPSTPALPAIFQGGLPPSINAVWQQLLNASRQSSFAFEGILQQLKIPPTFSIPVFGKNLTLARSGGNVSIRFEGEELVALPLIAIIVLYCLFAAVWLYLTHNAKWGLGTRILGILPIPFIPAWLVATLVEWLLLRKGYEGLPNSLKTKLLPMFTQMIKPKPIPPITQWLRVPKLPTPTK